MAWLVQKKTGIFHLGFRFAGEEINRSLKTRSKRVAEAILYRVEETISDVKSLAAQVGDFAGSNNLTHLRHIFKLFRI